MLVLKYLLMILGLGLFGSAGALVAYDIYLSAQLRRLLGRGETSGATGECGPFKRLSRKDCPTGCRPSWYRSMASISLLLTC